MSSDVGVSLLETLVLGDVVEVVSADHDGPPHLASGHDSSTEDTLLESRCSCIFV